jgi:sporulation protein YlmC with PRC-barrel domain
MVSANSLRGIKVKDPVGGGLGKIGEIIFDLETGRISYIAPCPSEDSWD